MDNIKDKLLEQEAANALKKLQAGKTLTARESNLLQDQAEKKDGEKKNRGRRVVGMGIDEIMQISVSVPTAMKLANASQRRIERAVERITPSVSTGGVNAWLLVDIVRAITKPATQTEGTGGLDPAQERARKDAAQATLYERQIAEKDRDYLPKQEVVLSDEHICRAMLTMAERYLPKDKYDELKAEAAQHFRNLTEGYNGANEDD